MRLYPWLAGLVFGALAISTGCGGGGGSSDAPATGNVSVLLTDAPLLAVPGSGRSFSELNVDVTGFDVSPVGTRAFTPMTLINGAARVNLLDLTNDQDWFAFSQLPVGRYDTFRLTIDPGTASLTDAANGTTVPAVMHANNTSGALEFRLVPPLVVTTSTAQHLVLVDWDARQSVSYAANPTPTGTYFLAGHFTAATVNRQAAPLAFRALPGRLTSVDATSGDMRVQIERHNNGRYLVRTSNTTTFEDMQGNALTIADFAANDFVIVSGTVDGNADVDATRVKKLPASSSNPPGGPGGGHGGGNNNGGGSNGGGNNGGPSGGNGTVAATVFAVGAVGQLDLATNEFVLRTGRGPIRVTYSDAGGAGATTFVDATVRPPQATNENGLTPASANGTVIVEVAGRFVAPTGPNTLPTIDATKSQSPIGRIVVLRRQ